MIAVSFVLSLPPISSAPVLVIFSILVALWIAMFNSPARSLILGLSLALIYAVTEILLSSGVKDSFTSYLLSHLVHFFASILSNLHWPAYLTVATWIHHRFHMRRRAPLFVELWFALGLPALFVLCEALVPRPLPWKLGHSLYQLSWVLQGSEFTGIEYLSFAIMGMGALIALLLMPSRLRFPDSHPILAVLSLAYWILPVYGMRTAETSHFSYERAALPRMLQLEIVTRDLTSRHPASSSVEDCNASISELSQYAGMIEAMGKESLKKDLVFWPTLPSADADLVPACREQVEKLASALNVPLFFNVSSPSEHKVYLVEPKGFSFISRSTKPLTNPRWLQATLGSGFSFPFQKNESRILSLSSGESIGITFDGEVLSNSFARETADNGIYAFVHIGVPELVGLRSEYWLRAFDTIRSIEYRVPSIRIDKDGRSFIVDSTGGNLADYVGLAPRPIKRPLLLPLAPPQTLYSDLNEWFTFLCGGIMATFAALILRRKTVPIPLYMREAQRRQQSLSLNGTPSPKQPPHSDG